MTMTARQARILHRARLAQRQGRAGDAIRLHMLASEIRTVRVGPERA